MNTSTAPVVGELYATRQGETFQVIAYGTRGVIVEFTDGSAELMDQDTWEALLFSDDDVLVAN